MKNKNKKVNAMFVVYEVVSRELRLPVYAFESEAEALLAAEELQEFEGECYEVEFSDSDPDFLSV